MPFVAIDKNTQERIDITKINHPRLSLKDKECVCQLCNEPLIVRSESIRFGFPVKAYFYHYKGVCKSDYESHPESPEHLRCKEVVADTLRNQLDEFSNALIEYEVKIPEIKRVADVMITFPMGWRIAHEIQLSPISPDNLEERTNAYNSAGIDVYWWLGKSANNASNKTWCIERYGYSLAIEIAHPDYHTDLVLAIQDDTR